MKIAMAVVAIIVAVLTVFVVYCMVCVSARADRQSIEEWRRRHAAKIEREEKEMCESYVN